MVGGWLTPTVEEWHAAVLGFSAGFYAGLTGDDETVHDLVDWVFGNEPPESEHLLDARDEAGYTLAAISVGYVIGHRTTLDR